MRTAVGLFGLVLLATSAGFGQRYPMLRVPGSPNGIYRMMEDSKSRIWMGTVDDVICFDGTHFYSLREYGFPHEIPDSFAEDTDGGIWIATQVFGDNATGRQGGIYRYQAGHVEKMMQGNGLSVASIAPGVVLASAGTDLDDLPSYGDLYRFRKTKGHWTQEKLLGHVADRITVDHQGDALFGCPGGWCELSHDSVVSGQVSEMIQRLQQHSGDPRTERVLRDRFGCLWFRSQAHGSYQCPSDPRPVFLPPSLSRIDSSVHIEETQEGSVLMLVPLILGRPGSFQRMDKKQIPPSIDTAIVGKDGTLWFGTDHGLFRNPYPFKLEYWQAEDGLEGAHGFIRQLRGDIFSQSNGSIVKLSEDRTRWLPVAAFDREDRVRDVAIVNGGRTLVAAENSISLFNEQWTLLSRTQPGVGPGVQGIVGSRLLRSGGGQLLLGGKGISSVTVDGDHVSLHPEATPSDGVPDMKYDAERDILWACDGRKLLFRRDGVWHSITQRDGLLDSECSLIALQPNGDLSMTYKDYDYAFVSNPASARRVISNHSEEYKDSVPDTRAGYLSLDGVDRLWLGDSRLNIATPEAARDGKWLHLGEEDGIKEIGLPTGFQSDSDNSLWYITETGIMHFSPPLDFTTRFPAPTISVSGISIGADNPKLAEALDSLPRNASLTAWVGTTQFDRRSALHMRYRLLPQQTEWESTTQFDLPLGKVRWGRHTLQVQAQLSTGPWSDVVEDSFTILKPVWLEWPALAGYLVTGFIVFSGGQRWRKRRRERARKAFPEVSEWRLAALSPEIRQTDGALLDARFEVGRVLARGGFATVAEGRDLQFDGRRCAIKIFRQELADKAWMARRFQQEVLALEQVRHANVVGIYGSGTLPGGGFYLVMEYIEGVTLRELLEAGSLPPHRTAAYLRQAGSALDEIHGHGICHRDLKPENLMIRSESHAGHELVLIDFSIAIVKDPDETLHGLSRAAGTIYYMAPEQAIGYASPATDIYSLAKIIIEMMTGQRLSVLLPDASMDLPARVREMLATLPVGLSSASIDLLSSALEFDPARRPQSAGEFAVPIAQDLQAGVGED